MKLKYLYAIVILFIISIISIESSEKYNNNLKTNFLNKNSRIKLKSNTMVSSKSYGKIDLKFGFEYEISEPLQLEPIEDKKSLVLANSNLWDLHADIFYFNDSKERYSVEIRTINGLNKNQSLQAIEEVDKVLKTLKKVFNNLDSKKFTVGEDFLGIKLSKVVQNCEIKKIENKPLEVISGKPQITLQVPLSGIAEVYKHFDAFSHPQDFDIIKILEGDKAVCDEIIKDIEFEKSVYTKNKEKFKVEEKDYGLPENFFKKYKRNYGYKFLCNPEITNLYKQITDKDVQGFAILLSNYIAVLFSSYDYTDPIHKIDPLRGEGPKNLLRIMLRNSFSEMFIRLLSDKSKGEQVKKFMTNLCPVKNGKNICKKLFLINYAKYTDGKQILRIDTTAYNNMTEPIEMISFLDFRDSIIFSGYKKDLLSPPPFTDPYYMGGKITIKKEDIGQFAIVEIRNIKTKNDLELAGFIKNNIEWYFEKFKE